MIAFHTDNLIPSTGLTSSKPGALGTMISSSSFLARAFCYAFFIGPNSYNVIAETTIKSKMKML